MTEHQHRTVFCVVGVFLVASAALVFLLTGCVGSPGKGPSDAQKRTTIGRRPIKSVELDGARMLYVLLKLRSGTAAADARIVDALSDLRWFTHVILVVPSWQEKPAAMRNPLVRRAVRTCRVRGIGVVWGRWLWVAWPGDQARLPNPQSHFDAGYYSSAIRRVKREARSLGAVATFLDLEPYGKSVQKPTLKFRTLTDDERHRVQSAVSLATRRVGTVDLISPTSSMRASHFAWSLVGLGKLRCDSKTYYTRATSTRWPTVKPPNGVTHRVHFFGSNLAMGRPEDAVNGQAPLTAAEVKSLDLSKIRTRYPQCDGLWSWVSYDILPDVIRSFAALDATPDPSKGTTE